MGGHTRQRVGDKGFEGGNDRRFDTAGICHNTARREIGQKLLHGRTGRLDRHGQQNAVGSPGRFGRIEGIGINQAPVERNFQIGFGPTKANHLLNQPPRFGRQSERATDQTNSDDKQTMK